MSKTQITAEPGIPQITITREFNAPRDLVFRAYIEPELVAQWLGPRDLTLAIDRWEARQWRHLAVSSTPTLTATPMASTASSTGHDPVQAIVQTFEFEGAPGHVALQTATFHDRGGTHASAHGLGLPVGRGRRRDGRLPVWNAAPVTPMSDCAELLAKLQSS